MNRIDQAQFGQFGSDFVEGAGEKAGVPAGSVIVAITALEAAQLDATNTTVESTDWAFPTESVSIPAGCTIYGRFTAVELHNDSAIMVYYGK